MLYARMNDQKTGFEPQRNLLLVRGRTRRRMVPSPAERAGPSIRSARHAGGPEITQARAIARAGSRRSTDDGSHVFAPNAPFLNVRNRRVRAAVGMDRNLESTNADKANFPVTDRRER
jgi:hypothetical protein